MTRSSLSYLIKCLPLLACCCQAWQQPSSSWRPLSQRIHSPLVQLHGWMLASHHEERGKTSLERWADSNADRNYYHNNNNRMMYENNHQGGGGGFNAYNVNYSQNTAYPNEYDTYYPQQDMYPPQQEYNNMDGRFEQQQQQFQGYGNQRQGWTGSAWTPGQKRDYNPYKKRSSDNGQSWNDNHWVNDNKKTKEHETMGPGSNTMGRRSMASSSSAWPSYNERSRYGERRDFQYQDDSRQMRNPYEGRINNNYNMNNNGNRWSPSSSSYQFNYDYDRTPSYSSGYNSNNNNRWNPRASSSSSFGYRKSSEYKSGVTQPIDSESFQNSINSHTTIGPEPEWERRRRLQKQRREMRHSNDSMVDMRGEYLNYNNYDFAPYDEYQGAYQRSY